MFGTRVFGARVLGHAGDQHPGPGTEGGRTGLKTKVGGEHTQGDPYRKFRSWDDPHPTPERLCLVPGADLSGQPAAWGRERPRSAHLWLRPQPLCPDPATQTDPRFHQVTSVCPLLPALRPPSPSHPQRRGSLPRLWPASQLLRPLQGHSVTCRLPRPHRVVLSRGRAPDFRARERSPWEKPGPAEKPAVGIRPERWGPEATGVGQTATMGWLIMGDSGREVPAPRAPGT